ncbi:MAG: NAD(P)H-dependent oxidoreductase [Bacteroidia bacterium]|nr:NAD(P)H-dependent oxidoreductase [Bacteroidia bacterium]
MTVTIISGSSRADNNSLRVTKAISELLEPAHTVNIIDFIGYDIPLTAQGGLNPSLLTPFQDNLIKKIDEAHVIILISPEYNWSTTPEILNMLHLLPYRPFNNLFNNKVFALVGVSTGRGGKAPAIHLMQILNKLISFSNHESIVSPRIFEAHDTKESVDNEGKSLGNAIFDKGLLDFCNYTIKMGERWFR